MVRLPSNWQEMMSSYALMRAVHQVEGNGARTEVTHHLIGAAFDLGFQTGWRCDLTFCEIPPHVWIIGDHRYIYLPTINDRLLHEVAHWEHPHTRTSLLVPEDKRDMFKFALEHMLGVHTPMVMTAADFIALRLYFSSMEAGWTRREELEAIVNAYNRRVTEAWPGTSLSMHFPDKPSTQRDRD